MPSASVNQSVWPCASTIPAGQSYGPKLPESAFATIDARPEPAAETLRPLPYLLYLVDGDGGGYNVFDGRAKLAPVQRVFRKHPMAECAPPAELITELGLPPGHPIHLGTVLARCPHYLASMRKKWGLPKTADEADGCGCAVC